MRTRLAVLIAATVVASGLAVSAPAPAAPVSAVPAPVAAAPVTIVPLIAAAKAKVPKRNDGLNEAIYWVHGIQMGQNTASNDCKGWSPAIKRYRKGSYTGKVRTIAYYTHDKNCNTRIASVNQNTSIKELGRKLAWDIYNRYTKKGKSVDAVGHSMGGLIIRAAITGVQKKLKKWPKKLFIEDVVTISTPHTGTLVAKTCGWVQCKEMRPGSSLLKWLSKDPHTAQRTDWTLIGSKFDVAVPWPSAISRDSNVAGYLSVGHKVIFLGGSGLGHTTIYKMVANSGYKLQYWNNRESKKGWITKTNWVSPVVMARNGNYYASKW